MADNNVRKITVIDENGTREYPCKDAEARSEIESAKDLNLDTDVFDVVEDASSIGVTVKEMAGATAQQDGGAGLVPQPKAGDENKVLSGAGTWVEQSGGKPDEYVKDASVSEDGKELTLTKDDGEEISFQGGVQSDLAETDDTKMSYIRNVPEPMRNEPKELVFNEDQFSVDETDDKVEISMRSSVLGMEYKTLDISDNTYTVSVEPNTYYKVNVRYSSTAEAKLVIDFSSSETLYQSYVQFLFDTDSSSRPSPNVEYRVDGTAVSPQNVPNSYSYGYQYLACCINGLTTLSAYI